ncbi:MAG: mechanosensitive ion channel family protein [Silvanigrellales bacterium]|nr:mechanosensitive ion channel family protein [Silvanigrellales bacterium]
MKKCSVFLAICLWFFSFSGGAQASGEEKPQTKACAPIVFSGQTLLCLEHGQGSLSAADRAAVVESRLQRVALQQNFDDDAFEFSQGAEGLAVVLGDAVLLHVTEQDAASHGAPAKAVAEEFVAKLRGSLRDKRRMENPRELLLAGVYTLATLLAFLGLVYALSLFAPRLHRRIDTLHARHFRSLRIQSIELLSANRMAAALHWLVKTARLALLLVLFYLFVPLVLSYFPWTASWAPKLVEYATSPLKELFRVTVEYVPNLFFVIVVAVVASFVLRGVKFLFNEVDKGNVRFEGFHREWASPTYKLVRVVVIAFAFVMAFPYLPGSSSPAFQGVSVFLGLLLSFGSSSAISNMVAGIVITYMRPFKVGDRVKIADTVGDVAEKNLLVTRIRSIKNVDITIPNAAVLGSHIVNFSSHAHTTGLILNTSITIGYSVPWRQVHELLIEAALKTPHIMQSPTPFVFQRALNDFHVSYEINASTRAPGDMELTYSLLHQNIQEAFHSAGVEIMSPHYTSLRDGSAVAIPAGV